MDKIRLKRGKNIYKKPWVKDQGPDDGTCFGVSYDRLVALLKLEGSVKPHEEINRVKIDHQGVWVYVENGGQSI